jgi:multiple sugar transport system substrate-binding protein
VFHVPKNAVYRRVSRRRFLELGGGVATTLGAGSVAVGLSSAITRRPAYAQSSADAKWKQYCFHFASATT